MKRLRTLLILATLLSAMLTLSTYAQQPWGAAADSLHDPCGYPNLLSQEFWKAASGNWGYGFDSLKADLNHWRQSPFVQIDSVGASVQNRGLFMLTIQDTAFTPGPRTRIWIHARTHPGEVQGTWVTNEMIRQILSDSPLARKLRSAFVFNILPMYNPDGVELGYARENAHMIDIESNWAVPQPEPEVLTLRRTFVSLMGAQNPIRVALNVHSAYDCARYFVYHTATGTSASYSADEQRFIALVQSQSLNRFKPWDYFVSWTSAPSTSYPESWFWLNHGAAVLALTYEDMNCPSASGFDTTAESILRGVSEYLGVSTGIRSMQLAESEPSGFHLHQNYPNPFNPTTSINYQLMAFSYVKIAIHDMLGREVETLVDGNVAPGTHAISWDASRFASGIYFCRMTVSGLPDGERGGRQTRRLVLVK